MNASGALHFGQMDVRVTIEQPTETINTTTRERKISTWTTFKKVWAQRLSASDEKFEASQGVSITGNSYRIRYQSGVTSMMRVKEVDSEEVFYIKGIEKVDRKSFLILKTEKRDNG